MRGQYSVGIINYNVYHGRGRGRKEIEGVHRVDFPLFPIPASTYGDERRRMMLRLHFLSALDASGAMRNSGIQTISIRAAEEYWNIFNGQIGTRAVEHVLVVKPSRLIPGSISGKYGAAIYRIPVEFETTQQSRIKQPDYRIEMEPLSFEQTAYSGYPVCEYNVSYYAAYSDGQKMWEVCSKKRIYTIGGTQYQFPNNE